MKSYGLRSRRSRFDSWRDHHPEIRISNGTRTLVRQLFLKSFSRGEHVEKLLESDEDFFDLNSCA